MFAQAIHAASARRTAPFIPVDCASIPRDLLEAELFGYAPGAFTGAAKAGKPGTFELATHGTLFLDEIGEMPLDMQAKLLRILQERRVLRVGGVAPVPVACTIIAATNQDLDLLVAQGRFRRDLLYRLDVIRLELPPLRERPDDIPHLVEYYWATKSQELGKTAQLAAAAMRLLEAYSWPGNIRELINIVERLLVGTTKPVIEAEDLPSQFHVRGAGSALQLPRLHLATVVAEVERRTLEGALAQAHGNRQKAAALLGMSRANFYRKAKLYSLFEAV
jgi:transcriptional regulator with PAS, ATPase and Fis domain